MEMTAIFGHGALVLLTIAIFCAVFGVMLNKPEDSPSLGLRGLKRYQAMERGGLFASAEPMIRMVARWVSYLPIREARKKIDLMLTHAGDWLGLTANEFIAMSALSAVGMLLLGIAGVSAADFPPIVLFFFFGLGTILPYLGASGELQKRQKQISRGLPVAIDLAALCMGAGLDFPGSLRQIVTKAGRKDDPLNEEFQFILRQLELGHTRGAALNNLAQRVPTEAVRSFVTAVVQSEEKGNPLAEVLRIQAGLLRMRRSVAGEEAAARAALMMMLPLMLIFGAILLVLMGPFVIQGMGTGF